MRGREGFTGFQQAVPGHRLRGRRTGRDSCSAGSAPDGAASRR